MNSIKHQTSHPSLSARRAWIEISAVCLRRRKLLVALRKESVDRNTGGSDPTIAVSRVALRKESVDRNSGFLHPLQSCFLSLSARRAWIEIMAQVRDSANQTSLSARRAWIEIPAG